MFANWLKETTTTTGNRTTRSIATLPFDPVNSGPVYLYFGITIPGHGVMFHYISGNPNPSQTMHLWRR